ERVLVSFDFLEDVLVVLPLGGRPRAPPPVKTEGLGSGQHGLGSGARRAPAGANVRWSKTVLGSLRISGPRKLLRRPVHVNTEAGSATRGRSSHPPGGPRPSGNRFREW